MKISSTELQLSLAISALDSIQLPEGTEPESRTAITLTRTILDDLLKREGPTIGLLQNCIHVGQTLEMEMLQALSKSSSQPPSDDQNVPPSQKNFRSLAQDHDQLAQRLDTLCAQLSYGDNPRVPGILRRAAEWELMYYEGLQKLKVEPFSHLSNGPSTGGISIKRPPGITPMGRLAQEFLQKLFAERRGPRTIENMTVILGGYSNQTYFLTVKPRDKPAEDIVLRKSNLGALSPYLQLDQEFHLLRSLFEAGLPVAEPIDLWTMLPGMDGKMYTMSRLPGRSPGAFFHDSSERVSDALWLSLAEKLAEFHRTPLEKFAYYIKRYERPELLQQNINECYRQNLRTVRKYWESMSNQMPSPYITWLINYLEKNIPPDTRRPVLTHGDFNIHNVLAVGNTVTALCDWECAGFGAPEQDLVYCQLNVQKHMEWQRFVDHYHACGGPELNPSYMAFGQAYSYLRIMTSLCRNLVNIHGGKVRDLRYTDIEIAFTAPTMQVGLSTTSVPF
jgi:aminoglycoside phosphotransferase (APT) family kinase protein